MAETRPDGAVSVDADKQRKLEESEPAKAKNRCAGEEAGASVTQHDEDK